MSNKILEKSKSAKTVEWKEGDAMTPKAVKQWLKAIESNKFDDEHAHCMEDSLYEALIRAIASGKAENPKLCCKKALETKNIGFARWCA